MRTFAKSQIRYSKSQRMGIFALIGLIVCIETVSYFVNRNSEIEHLEIPPEVQLLQAQNSSTHSKLSNELQNFNPNTLLAEEWQNLGFSEKQAQIILKYKYSLGGNFTSKEQIRNCYVISDEKFAWMEPYIQLQNVSSAQKGNYTYSPSNSYSSSHYKEKPKIHYSKFNPNDYQVADWMRIGFSEKQAQSILKYKKSLGGKFTSLDQIQASYVISEEKFREMRPFIILPKVGHSTLEPQEKEPEVSKVSKVQEKFNPNDLTREEWMELGFSEKQVNTIFNYKKSLGGKFKSAEILKKCYAISEEKFAEIEPYLVFDDL